MIISREILGVIAIIVSILGDLIYIASVLKGNTKPHVLTWFVWGMLSTILFLAQVFDGGGPGAWVTSFSALGHFIIAGLALFKGEKHITKGDWVCFATALITMPLWYFTKTPLYSVILIVLIDIVGFIPTFRKSFSKPYEETELPYALSLLKHISASIALVNFSFITAFYPLSMIFVNGSFVLMLMWRRSIPKTKNIKRKKYA